MLAGIQEMLLTPDGERKCQPNNEPSHQNRRSRGQDRRGVRGDRCRSTLPGSDRSDVRHRGEPGRCGTFDRGSPVENPRNHAKKSALFREGIALPRAMPPQPTREKSHREPGPVRTSQDTAVRRASARVPAPRRRTPSTRRRGPTYHGPMEGDGADGNGTGAPGGTGGAGGAVRELRGVPDTQLNRSKSVV